MSNQRDDGRDEIPDPEWTDDVSYRWFILHVSDGNTEETEYRYSMLRHRIVDDAEDGRHITSDTIVDLERVR